MDRADSINFNFDLDKDSGADSDISAQAGDNFVRQAYEHNGAQSAQQSKEQAVEQDSTPESSEREVLERSSVSEILQRNEELIKEYCQRLVDHFSLQLSNLPEEYQSELIDSIGVFDKKYDIVYSGLEQKYLNSQS